MAKRKVAILTPAYDGKTVVDFTLTMIQIFELNFNLGANLDIVLHCWMYESIIEKARNNLFTDAFVAGYDDIVMIDADQSFDPMAFFKLLSAPVDVVGVPVRMKTEEERYNLRPEDPKLHQYDPKTGLIKVERIGTGLLRLSRKAMAAIFWSSPEYGDGQMIRRRVFECQIVGGGWNTEDMVFCDKLRELGFDIWVDMTYTAHHFGIKKWSGDYKKLFKENYIEG